MIDILDYIRIQDEYNSYSEDIARIIKVCANNGVHITAELADELWNKHSDDYCAQWLILPDDDNVLFETILEEARTYVRGNKDEEDYF